MTCTVHLTSAPDQAATNRMYQYKIEAKSLLSYHIYLYVTLGIKGFPFYFLMSVNMTKVAGTLKHKKVKIFLRIEYHPLFLFYVYLSTV